MKSPPGTAGTQGVRDKEGEDPSLDEAELQIDMNIFPHSVIVIEGIYCLSIAIIIYIYIYIIDIGEEEYLKERAVKDIPEEELPTTRNNEEGMNRRLKVYNEANPGDSNRCTWHFFERRGIDILRINAKDPLEQVKEKLKAFIERVLI